MEIWDGQSAHGRQVFAEYLLLFLNPMDPRHKNVEGYKHIMGFFAGIPAPMPGAQMVAPKEIREKAIREFRSTACRLTDQWIESGERNGHEEPWERSVRYISPNYPEPIENALIKFWKRNPPTMLFYGNEPVLSTQSTLRQSDWAHLSGLSIDCLMERVRDYAIAQFALLMDSPSRYRIFRCKNCRSYFTKVRMPKKGVVIGLGSYCERCKNEASKRRVEEARKDRFDQLIGWAADALERWKPRNRFGKRTNWIVKKVNANLEVENRDTIKSNWVTRHLSEIEAEVDRRSHANSEG